MSSTLWYVYIVECADKSLYTGISIDYVRRIKQHNDGIGAKAVRGKRPVSLVHLEIYNDECEARRREIAIKRLSRLEKIALITSEISKD